MSCVFFLCKGAWEVLARGTLPAQSLNCLGGTPRHTVATISCKDHSRAMRPSYGEVVACKVLVKENKGTTACSV